MMAPVIVIVDDRITNRNIFSRLAIAVEPDVTVHAFGDPIEALAWLEENGADLVISDYKMPQMDGADFIREFRQRPSGIDVPVVVITAYDDRTFRLRALEAGATDFLQTPVDHYEFKTRVRNLLKLRQQQQIIKRRARTLEVELELSEKSRQEVLRSSREALAQVIDTVPALISAADRQGRLVFVNAMRAAWAGATPADFIGHDIATLLGSEAAEHSRLLDRKVFETGKALPSFEEEMVDRNGVPRVFLTTKAPLNDPQGEVVSVLTTSLDISDRKRAETHLRYMAHHDALTDLPNRVLLRERLERELARGRRAQAMFALHFLDLDRFKAVNDALGHHVGDRLLQEVTGRLVGIVRTSDTVARLGGDEFAILQTELHRVEDAAKLAARVVEVIGNPFNCDGHEINISVSIGITVFPRDADNPDELLRNADLAMYRAKAAGRNGYRFFASDMNRRARDAILLEADLRQGLGREQFVLHYQPQVSLRTGEIVGVEALLRWHRPGWGLLKPAEFLPLTEENGLIVPIGEWVLREACAQAVVWQEAGLPPLRIAINLSPVHFRKHDVRLLVTQALQDSGLDPSCLELELTEGILMENAEAAAATLRGLKELGIRFSIDDFGTGYSSLNYVRRFPIDRLKIDQSFIRNQATDPTDMAIARAIIHLAHSLGLQVIAEGVETAEQLARLRAEGCDEIQGYYFSEPLRAEDLQALLSRPTALPRVV